MVASCANSIAIYSLAVGITALSSAISDNAIPSLRNVAWIAGETGSVCFVAGLAEGVELLAGTLSILVETLRAVEADSIVEVCTVNVHIGY